MRQFYSFISYISDMNTVILKIVCGGKHDQIISNPDVSELIPTETGDIIGVKYNLQTSSFLNI